MISINEFGFYSINEKPTAQELENYYAQKYYQEGKGSYKKQYSDEETQYFYNKIAQKHLLLSSYTHDLHKPYSLLDVGCGEGFTLNYFKRNGWEVLGLDYSSYGVQTHNPDYISHVLTGDIYSNLNNLYSANKQFSVVWLDNVLEHVLNPLDLLQMCRNLVVQGGILVIEVPNDFSAVQLKLRELALINNDFWVVLPDHISYFNKQGLINLCKTASWDCCKIIGDFPIDFNLFNPESNYNIDFTKGKGAHLQRVRVENLLHNISPEKTNALYEILSDMGLGRQIIGIFKKV